MGDYIKLVSGKLKEIVALLTSAGAGDSGKIAKLNASGQFDSTFLPIDTDGTLAANSDVKIASQKATKTYVDALLGAQDAMIFKGVTDCSGNPNYPAADAGWTYRVSVAGKIGGASGIVVEVGDWFVCLTDGTASGTQAAQGTHWSVFQTNIDGAVTGPASAVADDFATFNSTTGKIIKDSGISFDTDNTLAANSNTRIASQQAVKGYVDGQLATISGRTISVTCTENIADGAFVNLYNSSGIKVRNADPNSNAKQAHGYVLAAFLNTATVLVYLDGINSHLTSLTPGATQYLDKATPGAATETSPTGTGVLSQDLGEAISTTAMLFTAAGTIVEQA